MQTGIWVADIGLMDQLYTMGTGLAGFVSTGGLVVALRMEAAQSVMVFLAPWSLFAVQALGLLVMSPFLMGALERFWSMLNGGEEKVCNIFRWYAHPVLFFRAIGLQVLLGLWQLLTQLVCMAPGAVVMMLASRGEGDEVLLILSSILIIAGMFGSYLLYCTLLPAQYVLAQQPDRGLAHALRRGVDLLRGRRKGLFFFRLSFLGWNVVSYLFHGIPDAFIFPYEETATLLFLNAQEGAGETADG